MSEISSLPGPTFGDTEAERRMGEESDEKRETVQEARERPDV